MIIKILDFIDLSPEILLEKILENIKLGEKITLDFYSLKSANYQFLEESIGNIFNFYSFESVKSQVNFKNVDIGIKEMIAKIIDEKII